MLEHIPADTPAKRQAASLLAHEFQISGSALSGAQQRLLEYRREKCMVPCSGVVLAGGASRRIGTSKANPLLAGRSLLAWQAEKLQNPGIQDVMLSGKDCPELPGTRVIPDKLPGWSPLGGLYSCFHAAENAHCLVLSVDTPMVPCAALVIFYKAHMAGITLLRCSGEAEPLRVYDTALKRVILPLIKTQRAPVRALSRLVAPAYFMGPEKFLLNCNTP